MKARVIGLGLFLALFVNVVLAQSYVLNNKDALLVPKSVGFVQELSKELYEKTGFSLFVVVVEELPEEFATLTDPKAQRQAFKQSFVKQLQAPYGILFFFASHKKIDILLEPKIPEIDINEIIAYDMVALLKEEKYLTPALVSASVINGYAQLADQIAQHYGATLQGNIVVDKSGTNEFVRYALYLMLGITFILVVWIWGRKK